MEIIRNQFRSHAAFSPWWLHGSSTDTFTLLLALALSFGASPRSGHANELSLLLNGKAYHMPHDRYGHLNEENWGVGLQYDLEKQGNWLSFISASEFKDSNTNVSYYFGGGLMRRFPITDNNLPWHLDAGFVAFLMHRKNFHDGDLFPGVLPALSIGTSRVALNVTYIPKVDPKMVELFFFQLKISLGQY